MSDKARLRAWLEAGNEVCPTDWNNFSTPDGGKPILRVAARIKDLKDDGLAVERTGTRNHCAVYSLVVSGASAAGPATRGASSGSPAEAPETTSLLEVPSAFDPYSEAA